MPASLAPCACCALACSTGQGVFEAHVGACVESPCATVLQFSVGFASSIPRFFIFLLLGSLVFVTGKGDDGHSGCAGLGRVMKKQGFAEAIQFTLAANQPPATVVVTVLRERREDACTRALFKSISYVDVRFQDGLSVVLLAATRQEQPPKCVRALVHCGRTIG